jgi:hypothetical protein
MVADPTAAALWNALETLARDLEASDIRMPVAAGGNAAATRAALVGDVRRYLAPRLRAPDAPAVVAVTGPTGAGTSSIVNALAGSEFSPTGVVRPTTRRPVVWAAGPHVGRWWSDLLDRLGAAGEAGGVLAEPAPATGFALVDVPAAEGPLRTLEWVAVADLCVFVTTPGRYADAEAAALLGSVHERGIPVVHVMNRLPAASEASTELLVAYVEMLHAWELIESRDPSLVLTVPYGEPLAAGALSTRLAELGSDAGRTAAITAAVRGRLASVGRRAQDVADVIEEDRDLIVEYRSIVAEAYSRQEDLLASDLAEGRLSYLAEHATWTEAAVDLTGVLTRRAGLAAQESAAGWWSRPEGRALLGSGGSLRRHGQDTAFDGQGMLEGWAVEMGDVAGAAGKRSRSRRPGRARLSRWAWPLVVDADRPVPRRLRRRLGNRVDGVVAEGRTRLEATMRAILDRDGARFDAFLGDVPDVGGLGRILTAAAVVAAAADGPLDISELGSGRGDGDESLSPSPTPDLRDGDDTAGVSPPDDAPSATDMMQVDAGLAVDDGPEAAAAADGDMTDGTRHDAGGGVVLGHDPTGDAVVDLTGNVGDDEALLDSGRAIDGPATEPPGA